MRSTLKLAALATAGALLFAACGDDDDDAAVDTTEAPAADSADSADSGGEATEETNAETDAPATDDTAAESTDDTGGESFDGGGSGEFCGYVQEVDSAMEGGVFAEDDPTPDEFREQIETSIEAFDGAIDRAPDEIRGDLETLREGFGQFASVLEEYDYDFTQLFQDPEAADALAVLDDPEFVAAGERVDQYFTEVCGLEDFS